MDEDKGKIHSSGSIGCSSWKGGKVSFIGILIIQIDSVCYVPAIL